MVPLIFKDSPYFITKKNSGDVTSSKYRRIF